MPNGFDHEYKFSPLIEDLFAVIEKHYGEAQSFKKTRLNSKDFLEAAQGAVILYCSLCGKGNQVRGTAVSGFNRNTFRKYLHGNKFLEPLKETDLLKPAVNRHGDCYAYKAKMNLVKVL